MCRIFGAGEIGDQRAQVDVEPPVDPADEPGRQVVQRPAGVVGVVPVRDLEPAESGVDHGLEDLGADHPAAGPQHLHEQGQPLRHPVDHQAAVREYLLRYRRQQRAPQPATETPR